LNLKRIAVVFLIIVLQRGIDLQAVQADFIVNSGISYRNSFTDQRAVDYMNEYLSLYTENVNALFDISGDSYSLSGINMAPLGKPHVESMVGITIGGSFYESEKEEVTVKSVDPGLGDIVNGSLAITFSMDKISEKFGKGFWEKTDLTVTYNNLNINAWEYCRMHLSHIGAALRKQIINEKSIAGNVIAFQGASLSLGTCYSTLTGKEDDVGHYLYHYSENTEDREIVTVDPNTGGTVTVLSPSTPEDDEKGLVHYPYIDFVSFSVNSEAKGYVTLFKFLDVFSGIGIAILPHNKGYSTIDSDVKVRITDDNGLDESYTGKFTTTGEGKGKSFMVRSIFGLVINAGPVKIPFQVSKISGGINAVVAGLLIVF